MPTEDTTITATPDNAPDHDATPEDTAAAVEAATALAGAVHAVAAYVLARGCTVCHAGAGAVCSTRDRDYHADRLAKGWAHRDRDLSKVPLDGLDPELCYSTLGAPACSHPHPDGKRWAALSG